MRYHWIQDCIKQRQYDIQWEPGDKNKADYFTKHHPVSHHKNIRHNYFHNSDINAFMQGCIDISHFQSLDNPNKGVEVYS